MPQEFNEWRYVRLLAKFAAEGNLILPSGILNRPNTMRSELLDELGSFSGRVLFLIFELLLQLLCKADVGWTLSISFL